MSASEIEPANSTSGSKSESESTPPPISNKTQLTPNSSSDSEPESDPDPSIKPISSKPMDIDVAKKPRSKNPALRYSPPPFTQSTGKRAPADNDGGDSKRVKKTTVVGVAAPDASEIELGVEKKNLFQRLWSEENEIELIQGMTDYVEQKGKDPLADLNDFYDFVNDSLNIEVNNRQVLTKGRRLKKKFENNVAKVEKSGKVRSFSNPHEKKMYDLSKNLWGSGSNNNVVMKSSSKKGSNVKVNVIGKSSNNSKSSKTVKAVSLGNGKGKEVNVNMNVNGVDVLSEEVIMSEGLEKVSGVKKDELEKKWKDFKMQELEVFVEKVELLKEQAEVMMNAVRKSGGAK